MNEATILQVSPKQDILFSMPNHVYSAMEKILSTIQKRTPSGRTRGLTVQEAMSYLPDRWRALVEARAVNRQK